MAGRLALSSTPISRIPNAFTPSPLCFYPLLSGLAPSLRPLGDPVFGSFLASKLPRGILRISGSGGCRTIRFYPLLSQKKSVWNSDDGTQQEVPMGWVTLQVCTISVRGDRVLVGPMIYQNCTVFKYRKTFARTSDTRIGVRNLNVNVSGVSSTVPLRFYAPLKVRRP